MSTADYPSGDYQAALDAVDDHEAGRFGAPDHGRLVERLVCERRDLAHEDGTAADARDVDGTPIQIKACRREHSNGATETVPGRWDAWSDGLLHLLADDGEYILVVYDGSFDAQDLTPEDVDDYLLASARLDAVTFGELVDGAAWHDHNRPSKGQRARVFWTAVFDRDTLAVREEVNA